MIKSMTGFGRCEIAEADRKFTVEMKGVNHRYLDVNIRMPTCSSSMCREERLIFSSGMKI